MRFRWRRVVLFLLFTFFGLQFAAVYVFAPTESTLESRGARDYEEKDTHKSSNDLKLNGDEKREVPNALEDQCEILHKDAQSAITRASSDFCKSEISRIYCDNKAGKLFEDTIERKCPHESTYLAEGNDVSPDEFDPKADIRIAYLLIVHGRAIRQLKRLFKLIYHKDHFFYFHVDSRSEYLYQEVIQLAALYENAEVAPWREAPIWGGTSLLTTIFNGIKDLIKMDRKWDFFINLSFADLPVKSNNHLIQFLNKHRSKNFLKSHGREADKFIKKQGLDRIFLECEHHMWRIGEREMPKGVIIDGGSDWITLSYEFSKYLIESQDTNLNQLKNWFNYTLLPAESFFHTAVQNSEHCESFVDNNLRMTNWNRARGCKCQYRHIVDWCGCSPNDYLLKDLGRLKTSRPLFFARKFEEFVSQAPVNKLDFEIYGAYPQGTKSINSYWESIYSAKFDQKSDHDNDARKTIFESWKRRTLGSRNIFASVIKVPSSLTDVHIYQEETAKGEKIESGYVVTLKSGFGEEAFMWEVFIKNKQVKKEQLDEMNVEVKAGTNWDVKELVFRDPGGLTGPFSKVFLAFRFKNVSAKFKAVALVQDPSGRPVDQLEMEIPEDEAEKAKRPKSSTFHCEGVLGGEVVAAEKLALTMPMRPGLYTISLFIRNARGLTLLKSSKTRFMVTPLEFVRNDGIQINSNLINGGVETDNLNEKNKDLSAWMKILPEPLDAAHEIGLKTNASFTGEKLTGWIDHVNEKGWYIDSACGPNNYFFTSCEKSYWSTFYPDPKTELTGIKPNGRIR